MGALIEPLILIITNQDDFTADLVIKRLRERELPYVRFNTETFPMEIQGSIEITQDSNNLQLATDRWKLRPKDIRSIWYRRPVASHVSKHLDDRWDQEFAVRESWEFLANTWCLLEEKYWLHHPDILRKAEKKLFQLEVARNMGIQIPATLVTSSAEDALAFYQSHHRQIVAKPLSHGGYGAKNKQTIFTIDLESQENIDFSGFRYSPAILQAKVQKKADVRVTVMGEQVFAYTIYSPTEEVDWRKAPPHNVRYERCPVPDSLLEQIQRLMSKMHLKFGALDFCLDLKDNWVFLEINPNGQWAWFDIQNNSTEMTESLIKLLYD